MAADLYKQAGVDVEKGYEAVERMKKHIQRTNKKEVLGGIGAFAGLFDLSAYELMLSESQERMLLVVKKGREQEIIEVFQNQPSQQPALEILLFLLIGCIAIRFR